MSRRAAGAGLAGVVLVASLWFGQAPPRTDGAYRQRAVETLLLLRSQVRTAGLWLDQVRRSQVSTQAAQVALDEVDTDARATSNRFTGWTAPTESTALLRQVSTVATATTSGLLQVRQAAERGDWAAAAAAGRDLTQVDERLSALLELVRQESA